MEWENSRESTNIEDRRSDGGGGVFQPGGGGLGVGAIVVLALIGYFTGIDPRLLIGGAQILVGNGGGGTYSTSAPSPAVTTRPVAQNVETRRFVASILGETEDVWSVVLPAQENVAYIRPKLVLYSGSTPSPGCGEARSAMGPFYCPKDRKVYLDMSFFDDMKNKYGGGGDFAYAYVIAHEVGHHVQNLLGILPEAEAAENDANRTRANAISVRIELMADCLAGVWAANADQKWHILDRGDVERALAAAQAIGDDRLQKAERGFAVPDSFTHGTSAQRQQWLSAGLKSGQVDTCTPLYR